MKTHKFLVTPPTPRLDQAFETAASGGGFASNETTRRTFLKRSGGATVASLVAWNLANTFAEADGEPNPSASEWRMTCIKPDKLSIFGQGQILLLTMNCGVLVTTI